MENTALAQIQNVDQLLPSVEVLKNMKQVADYMVAAKMLPPGYKDGSDLMVVAMRGRELGVPMGQAIQGMFPMRGRIGFMGGFLLSMVRQRLPFSDIRIKETTKEKCVLEWKRGKDDAYVTEEYSMEEVEACNYNKNPLYGSDGKQKQDASGHLLWTQKTPWGDTKNMLYWRCVTRTINRWFSDVFGSPVYTADELQDSEYIDITPAGKAAVAVPYATQANSPKNSVESDKLIDAEEEKLSKPVVTEIEEAVIVQDPVIAEQAANAEAMPPVANEHDTKVAKMSQPMIDALVLQLEKDLWGVAKTVREVDDIFDKFKTCGVPGKVLTTCFKLKIKRIDELKVKK